VTDATRLGYEQQPVPDEEAALHSDIEETREQLGETVDEIGRRLDLKSRMTEVAHDAGQRLGDAGQRANEVGRKLNAYGRGHPTTVARGATVLIIVGIVILAWRRRR
jgi:Protein of unknown function (DUF3618)